MHRRQGEQIGPGRIRWQLFSRGPGIGRQRARAEVAIVMCCPGGIARSIGASEREGGGNQGRQPRSSAIQNDNVGLKDHSACSTRAAAAYLSVCRSAGPASRARNTALGDRARNRRHHLFGLVCLLTAHDQPVIHTFSHPTAGAMAAGQGD
ncbi:hypothetical protein LY78DRAFT_278651 [Colletotrichum sublineola]|nr:hypothetical protein LY78DRAFT_278651 [Colletotrichum sublineola]